MISCIIYEDNDDMQKRYQEIVNSYFEERNLKVKFHIYSKYQKNLEAKLHNIKDKKIFILDIEVPGKSGLDLARSIRSDGDWDSPLIIVTSYEHLKSTGLTAKMLMLDFISKKENLKRRLQECLNTIDIIMEDINSYTFQYNGELHHINYQDILCFEKDLNDNYTFIYTTKTNYKIKESIIKIEKELEETRCFFKISRSCIINIDNITELDLNTNTLHLGNHSINLLTKENREQLKKKIDKE